MELLEPTGLHVAIIMDGNGRWAQARGLPRVAGHRAGVEAVRRVVRAAPGLGISTLTLYAFSADNWQRPQPEVTTLMRLMHEYLLTETHPWAAHGIRVSVIGRRDRLSRGLREVIEAGTIRRGRPSFGPPAASTRSPSSRAIHSPVCWARSITTALPMWICSSAPAANKDSAIFSFGRAPTPN